MAKVYGPIQYEPDECLIDGVKVPTRTHMLEWQERGLSQTASGYGRRLTTTRQVWYGGRWRRVYCCIWSNAGTCYIGRSISAGKVVN